MTQLLEASHSSSRALFCTSVWSKDYLSKTHHFSWKFLRFFFGHENDKKWWFNQETPELSKLTRVPGNSANVTFFGIVKTWPEISGLLLTFNFFGDQAGSRIETPANISPLNGMITPNKYPLFFRCIWGWLRIPSQGNQHFSRDAGLVRWKFGIHSDPQDLQIHRVSFVWKNLG